MNENINICEILRGHEDETFWSPTLGDIKACPSYNNKVLNVFSGRQRLYLSSSGKDIDGNMQIFPSKDQRDWVKWNEENNLKIEKEEIYPPNPEELINMEENQKLKIAVELAKAVLSNPSIDPLKLNVSIGKTIIDIVEYLIKNCKEK